MPDEYINDQLHNLFTGNNPEHGHYTLVGTVDELIKGRLLHFVLRRKDHGTDVREVALFLNVDLAGGDLWDHEVRNLLRLKMLGHPALPDIVDGSFDRRSKVAFIMTRLEGQPIARDWRSVLEDWAKAHPVVAFEQFSLLADALSQLHGTRIMHRNLTLGAVRMKQQPENPARATLSLGRFELSALLNNLLHSVHGPDGKTKYDEAVQALFLTPSGTMSKAHHLAYLAPENHPAVFCDVQLRRLDHGSTDVFGLGVLGWELFVGPLVDRLPDDCAVVEAAKGDELPAALARLHTAMRRELSLSTKLPRVLKAALLEMLDPSPTVRSSSFEASAALQRDWSGICSALDPAPRDTRPRLVAFMPEQSVVTIYEQRNWTDHSPDTQQGCDELQAFLEEELREADLVHCQGGGVGFVEGDAASLAEAEWVLIGQQAVWFCSFLYDRNSMGERIATHTDTLVIRYLADRRFASEVVAIRPKRRVGKIDLMPFKTEHPLDDVQHDRPSWEELTKAVRNTGRREQDKRVQEMLRAVSFMLDYQSAALRARQYPFFFRKANDGRFVLTYDKSRDRRWLHGDELLTAYCADPRRRPLLGDFARGLLADDDGMIAVGPDRPTPRFNAETPRFRVLERLDADSIVVEPTRGRAEPEERGWLRPWGDHGTDVQLRREVRGLAALRQKAGLARVLHTPSSIELRSRRGATLEIPPRPGEKPLRGKAPQIIADMLRLHPFYALQGPPGTGKSTVVAHALREFLRAEHGARVLVSAQSNDALNQLAVKCVELLQPVIENQSILILRELSRTQDGSELPKELQGFTAEAIAGDLVDRIEKRVEDGSQGARNAAEVSLMGRWGDVARENLVELTERIRAGADIVLATCSIAGTLTDDVGDPVFDWVIIEEAAKAWPTEIIMPLVRGVRWTLVGDHLQLGPHRAQDVSNFLESLGRHKNERIKLHYAAREKYTGFIQMFATFFRGREANQRADAANPVDTLDTQFRMHPDIALPFARAFYPGTTASGTFLDPDPEIKEFHMATKPAYLKGAPLVWLDTSNDPNCGDKGYWWNEGEAELIRELARELGLADDRDPKKLAVLSPYRRQVRELDRGFLEKRVHTVHSFQGGQAKTVIVSLVRSTSRGPESLQNVGHTAQPEVVNVMLSRAQQLLVVVGNLTHFERHGGKDWQKVIDTFGEVGTIVDSVTGEIVGGRGVAP